MSVDRVILIIMDACGVGELPDAADYGDRGAATIPHVAAAAGGLAMPTCRSLGLGNIVPIEGGEPVRSARGCWGKMAAQSPGKDSTPGHWEIGGIVLPYPFPVFPDGFPEDLVREFERLAGVKTIGNVAASGTEIIERLGERHLRTGEIILYTSADSVFQLAAHEDTYPIEKQYEICRAARDLLQGEYGVGRVIARPFVGRPGSFKRTAGRRDFSLEPPSDTVLDLLVKDGRKVLAIGKIYDLFAGRGISQRVKTKDNAGVASAVLNAVENDTDHDLIFANFVDFDQSWGHRNDEVSFARGLEQFDHDMADLLPKLRDGDMLILTADHGCDPTIKTSTDHTREYVPLMVYGPRLKSGIDLGTRGSFADVAVTIAEVFGLEHEFSGAPFLNNVID